MHPPSVRRAFRALTLVALSATVLVSRAADGATVYGLTASGTFILRFDSATPGKITHVALISGLTLGERIVGIDFRPRTGEVFGVGVVSGAADTIRVYTINPLTGAATLIPGSTPFTVTHGDQYAVAFNPTVDRIRVSNNGDENFRINPNNGARADTPTNDTDLSPIGRSISGVAYDRSWDTGLAVANRTTAFAISTIFDGVYTMGGINQSPSPNGGALQNFQAFGVNATGDAGFDIGVDGTAFAALTVAGVNQLYTINLTTGAATLVGAIGEGNLAIGGLAVAAPSLIAIGADRGGLPRVRLLDGETRTELRNLLAYPVGQKTGVRVALGDVNLDSVPDIITGPGAGAAPEVHVIDGATGLAAAGTLGSFLPFDAAFKGGVFVAAGDVNGDGFKDVVCGNGAGTAAVIKVFSGATGLALTTIDPAVALPGNTGGVQVACADFNRDGIAEIVAAAGSGHTPEVRVFDGTGAAFTSASLPNFKNVFLAYGTRRKAGISVATGDVNGDGFPDIVTGAGRGDPPEVAAFSGVDGALLTRFFATDRSNRAGVRVAVADLDQDGRGEIVTTLGSGTKATRIRVFDALTKKQKTAFLAFDAHFVRGAFVGTVRR